jgi:hypothetical protein
MWGGGECSKKNLLHWALEARYDTAFYNPLKSPVGAHVHKTAYGPLIDTVLGPVHNAFDAAKSITCASGRGLGPGNRDFFGPLGFGFGFFHQQAKKFI